MHTSFYTVVHIRHTKLNFSKQFVQTPIKTISNARR